MVMQRPRASAAPREVTREVWSSRAGFVLASIGSAVGIGNLSSAVSILELPVATLIDVWGISRWWAAVASTAVVMLVGLPSALSYTALRLELIGTPLLDLEDFAFGTVGMTLGALALSVAAGWFVDESIVRGAVGGRPWLVRLFLGALRVFIPAVLALSLAVRMLSGVSPGGDRQCEKASRPRRCARS
jgi:NSS family neurotransmitter:Na+ symporter